MLFNSYVFLFAFLPVTLAGFFWLGRGGHLRAAALWLTLASLFFYSWWNPRYLLLIVLSIIGNYWLGVAIHRARQKQIPVSPRFLLTVGVVLNLIVLGYYKYAHFFVHAYDSVWGLHWNIPAIFLPLAISFFTFTQIAYLVDAYHGETDSYDFLYYALFVSFFPHLIAGPIVSYRRIMPYFSRADTYRFDSANFAAGLSMFSFGLAKKVVIADNLAVLPQTAFDYASNPPPDLLMAWLGTLGYTFQLYFDFSGYSDMAIGLARMFNVRFPLNFNSPYKARDIADFWRRWHMTLSHFLRDHIYIPLGGNRHGEACRYLSLMTTMLLGGLWHGADWTFVLWGGLHGVCLVIHRGWERMIDGAAWAQSRALQAAGAWLTFLVVVIGWVLFRSHGLRQALHLLATMVHPPSRASLHNDLLDIFSGPHSRDFATALVMLLIAASLAFFAPNTDEIFRLAERYTSRDKIAAVPKPLWRFSWSWAVATGSCLALAILYLSNPSEFLYFRF